jgi:hypothetical protein
MDFFVGKVSERHVVFRPWSSNEGRRPMFDALLYCQVMADIKYGYFLLVADFVRTITAQFRALWAASLRAMAHGTLAQRKRHTPVGCQAREAWLQSLARLETYVDSMA